MTASEIQAGTVNQIALGQPGATAAFFGVVPDGVASITVSTGSAAATTVQVTDNFFVTQIPRPRPNTPSTITQQWYAADGTLIKSTHTTVTLRTRTVTVKSAKHATGDPPHRSTTLTPTDLGPQRPAPGGAGLAGDQAATGSFFLRPGLAGADSSAGRGAVRNSAFPTTL